MTFEKATYSYSGVLAAIDAVKVFDFSYKKDKVERFEQYKNLSNLYRFCAKMTNCFSFTDAPLCSNSHLGRYLNAVVSAAPKKELSEILKMNERFLKNELIEIYQMMESGEVNAVD